MGKGKGVLRPMKERDLSPFSMHGRGCLLIVKLRQETSGWDSWS
jgi:hypothetical protein